MSHCSKKFNMISSEFHLALSIDVQLLNSFFILLCGILMRILNYWLLDQGDLVSRERGICRMERLLAIHHFRCHNYKCTGCFGKCHSSRGPLDMSTISSLGGLSVRGCCCILSLSSVRKQLTP